MLSVNVLEALDNVGLSIVEEDEGTYLVSKEPNARILGSYGLSEDGTEVIFHGFVYDLFNLINITVPAGTDPAIIAETVRKAFDQALVELDGAEGVFQ